MPVLSCYVSTVCELLKIVHLVKFPLQAHLDRKAGTVNPQMLFICPVGSCDWVHSGWPRLNAQREKSFGVNGPQLVVRAHPSPFPALWKRCRCGSQPGAAGISDLMLLTSLHPVFLFKLTELRHLFYCNGQEPLTCCFCLKN